jgi:lipid-A-disaccharide synthase
MLVAGEASGDHHGARLVAEVRRRCPEVHFFGMGIDRLAAAGMEPIVDARGLGVVGLWEVIAAFGALRKAFLRLQAALLERRPDLLILIDYPDFNLRLARIAKRHGIPVLFYVSPQIWAWRAERVHTIGARVDMMAVLFPFEVDFYQQAGVPVRFVGHPLAEEVQPSRERASTRARLGIPAKSRLYGLFPGSRRTEVRRLLPKFLKAAERIRAHQPDSRFVLPKAPTLDAEEIAGPLQAAAVPVIVTETELYDVTAACDAVVTASGTMSLEIALLGIPMVIVYQVSPITYHLAVRLMTVQHIGLANIIAQRRIVPELIQDAVRPDRIAEELRRLTDDPEAAASQRAALADVGRRLGAGGTSERVAALVLEMLGAAAVEPPPCLATDSPA